MIAKRPKRNLSLIAGAAILAAFVLVAVLADLIAPYDYREQSRKEPNAPASTWSFSNGPRVYGNRMTEAIAQSYEPDPSRSAEVGFFVKGYSYRILGVIPWDRHLAGTSGEGVRMELLGTDALGRDRFSRLLMAIRFSLIVCPLGAFLASLLGILIGTISGYSHRYLDTALMGVTDAVISLPALIVILAVRVAFPLELPPLTAAVMLIGIFTFTGWAEMARLTRGLVRKVRGLDYIAAARVSGATPLGIMTGHVLPNIARPLLTQATLILPAFLLAEAALSFLGVGLQEPEPSLGNMLAAASELAQLQQHPFIILSPAIVIAVFVLGVRLLGTGLKERDDARN